MKKKLLLIVLALAILTSLTAGTLAVYTKTEIETENIEAKRFAFSAAGQLANKKSVINLAPTESMEYDFSIANADSEGGPVAEVALQFDVTIDFASALTDMEGLKATLYLGNEKVGESTNGVLKYTTYSTAGVSFDKDYKVIITWVDEEGNGDDAKQTAAGSKKASYENGFTLTVVATQYIPTT